MQNQRANFAIVLKAIRQERGLYQAELAELAGVPQPFVSRLERGEQDLSVVANALRIIRALELSPELLERVLGLGPTSPSDDPGPRARERATEAGSMPRRLDRDAAVTAQGSAAR